MGVETKIQWTHHSWSPWIGCSKVSPGCAHCYAEELMDHRYGRAKWGKDGTRSVTSDSYWRQPLRWNREAMAAGERHRVFPSLCDPFEDRPELVEPRARFFDLICRTPNLDWLVLTKRPENALRLMVQAGLYATENPWLPSPQPNLWIGVSVEDQQRADERIPILNEIPTRVRFISFEPLLGPIETQPDPHNLYGGIHWAIIGGESGKGARPCDLVWIRSLRDQCSDASVACFIKQMGSRWIMDFDPPDKPVIGTWKDPKGGDPDEWPADLRVREFPIVNLGVTR